MIDMRTMDGMTFESHEELDEFTRARTMIVVDAGDVDDPGNMEILRVGDDGMHVDTWCAQDAAIAIDGESIGALALRAMDDDVVIRCFGGSKPGEHVLMISLDDGNRKRTIEMSGLTIMSDDRIIVLRRKAQDDMGEES